MEEIFNGKDEKGAPVKGDRQRLQMEQDDTVIFTKAKLAKRALSELMLPKTHSATAKSSTHGLKINVSDTTYDVSANVLRGTNDSLPMANQPWHCDHAASGAYSGKKDFPFVVVFPRSTGKNYRCNVVLWNLCFKGEITFESDDAIFLRGDAFWFRRFISRPFSCIRRERSRS